MLSVAGGLAALSFYLLLLQVTHLQSTDSKNGQQILPSRAISIGSRYVARNCIFLAAFYRTLLCLCATCRSYLRCFAATLSSQSHFRTSAMQGNSVSAAAAAAAATTIVTAAAAADSVFRCTISFLAVLCCGCQGQAAAVMLCGGATATQCWSPLSR